MAADQNNNNLSESRVAVIDIAMGRWIWRSQPLLGPVTARSLHYDASAPNGGSISIGTSSALYITR